MIKIVGKTTLSVRTFGLWALFAGLTVDMLAAGGTITVAALGTEKQSQSLHLASSLDDLRCSKSTLVPSVKSLNCGVRYESR